MNGRRGAVSRTNPSHHTSHSSCCGLSDESSPALGLLLLAEVSTWWPIAPSARKLPITYTKLPVLDNCPPLSIPSRLWLSAC
eukprot:COSAG04_NODE_1564_length_6324_cov_18.572369_6_plen_82_part_00